MREKLETLPLAQLRELAKSQGLKGTSTMKKAELIDLLIEQNEKDGKDNTAAEKKPESHTAEGSG